MSDSPAWLKRSENGSLGEARTRSFLLERFWVLERSVDKDGADYLIQRRLTADNFLSRDPPRLGVVQVKFMQDEKTAIYLAPEYVCDKDGRPYSEFFLLVHTGNEDQQRQFLITAIDITEDFKKSILDSGIEKYYLPGAVILQDSKYEVLNKSRALDKIEHALKNANFLRNRAYFRTSQYIKVEKHHIDSDYLIPIDNGYCHIDKEFYKQKQKLQETLFDLEEVVEAIGKILRSTDPVEAYEIFEECIQQYIDSRARGSNLSFGVECFNNEDFIASAKNQRARLKKLRELHLENDYLQLLDDFERLVMEWILSNKAWAHENTLQVTAQYESKNLKNIKLTFEVLVHKQEKYPIVVSSELGLHVFIFRPSSLINRLDKQGDISPPDIVKANSWQVRRPFQKEVDIHLLGEDLVSPWM